MFKIGWEKSSCPKTEDGIKREHAHCKNMLFILPESLSKNWPPALRQLINWLRVLRISMLQKHKIDLRVEVWMLKIGKCLWHG